jgi:pimeloyl-ACP methyl ester carboxylesterase
MAIVLVHGNPETAAIWDLLAARLVEAGHDEPVRLSPPGFGAPVPEGFGATVREYRDWLIDELERIAGPIDLVGHDWGGGHVVAAAMARPDLIRSWCSDVVFDAGYTWHELAQIWQAPGDGEAWVTGFLAQPPEARAAGLAARGMDPAIAAQVAWGADEAMGECILRLYRSAAQPAMAELGAGLEAAAARPGLALLPTEDHMVGTDAQRRRAAERAGARVEVLDGLGHWWMTQDAGRAGAAAMSAFWASL